MADERILSVLWEWTDDGVMKPAGRFAKQCDDIFTVGEKYLFPLPEEARSKGSHNHYFARLAELFANLPETLDGDGVPATAEHMRKWGLIRTGWRDERSIVCSSAAKANKLAAFIRPIDDYGIVVVVGATVVVMTAKSQRHRAMGKVAFEKSKQDVIGYWEAIIANAYH